MGRQIGILMTPLDRTLLWEHLLSIGATAFGYYHESDALVPLRGLADLDNVPMAWLARRGDTHLIRLRQVPTRGYWLIDNSVSPVIELSGGRAELDSPACGRLYYRSEYAVQGRWVRF